MLSSGRSIGAGVLIGSGTVLVADELVLGDGVRIGDQVDLRASVLRLGSHARVADRVRVLSADGCELGAAATVDTDAEVVCRRFSVGSGTYCGPRLRIGLGASMEQNSVVTIGARCQIAPDVGINATEAVHIGDEVGISSRVTVWTHGYHSGHRAAQGHAGRFAGVVIEDAVWLAFDVTVLPGVRIGAGTIVGVRSVVQRSLPSGVLAVGVPARVKKQLEAARLSAQQRAGHVGVVLDDWLGRLRFKGLTVTAAGTGRWQVGNPPGSADLGGWTVQHTHGTDRVVITSVAATVTATFDFAGERVDGVLDELGHDFRDFCRRRSWPVTYERNSTAIVPECFARLLRATGPTLESHTG